MLKFVFAIFLVIRGVAAILGPHVVYVYMDSAMMFWLYLAVSEEREER